MNTDEEVRKLLATAGRLAECKAARAAWVKETCAAWREAQHAMNRRCAAWVDRLSEAEFERLCDEEEAKVEAVRAPLKAAAERDLWPREIYFHGI